MDDWRELQLLFFTLFHFVDSPFEVSLRLFPGFYGFIVNNVINVLLSVLADLCNIKERESKEKRKYLFVSR